MQSHYLVRFNEFEYHDIWIIDTFEYRKLLKIREEGHYKLVALNYRVFFS